MGTRQSRVDDSNSGAPGQQRPDDGHHRVGVTGHLALRDPDAVREAIRAVLSEVRAKHPDTIACSALAPGADTLFAEAALELGMPLEVVVPFSGYPLDLSGEERRRFDALLARATVTELHLDGPSGAAYVAAGMWVIERSQLLVAVWDGDEAQGMGGTAEIVARARDAQIPVRHVPATRAETEPT